MDTLAPHQRSEPMALVRLRNTAVELRVRRLVHSMGYRYRLHRKELPRKRLQRPGCNDDKVQGDRLLSRRES
jgi:G:T-mismatch repair DNA endonuclease (very short patch repair protein)